MTLLLERAINEVKKLTDDQQDALAQLILENLDEQRWDELFSRPESETLLEKLANEALAEYHAGKTQNIHPGTR